MSDSSRIRVSIVPESTFGTTPTDPDWLTLATTGHTMRDRINYQKSQTINSDRNALDLVRLSKASGGGIPMELTYSPVGEGLMRLITAALAGTETAVAAATDVDTVVGTKTITRSSGSFITDGFEVGDIVKTSGVQGHADIGFRKLTAVAALTLTCEADDNFAGDTSGDMVVTRGARIRNGTEKTSFSVEVAFLDLQKAIVFTGQGVNVMDFSIADEAITRTNFSLTGSSSARYEVNNGTEDEFGPGTPTYTAPTVHPILDSISVPEIRYGGGTIAAKSINKSFNNNIVPRTQVGALGPQSQRYGDLDVSGSTTAYLSDFTLQSHYADNTESDVWVAMIDANGRGFTISYPRIKFGDAGSDVGSANEDVLDTVSTTALKHSTQLITVSFQRWD